MEAMLLGSASIEIHGVYARVALGGLSPWSLAVSFQSLCSICNRGGEGGEGAPFLSLVMNETLTKATMYTISQLLQGLDRIKKGMCNRADSM